MAKISIPPFNIKNMRIDVVDIPMGIRINLKGTIEMQHPEVALLPLFNDIHNNIIASNIKLVEVNLTNLDYMNSGGIATMIRWFVKIPSLDDDCRYKINIKYNKEIMWQEKGLPALTKLAPGFIELIED